MVVVCRAIWRLLHSSSPPPSLLSSLPLPHLYPGLAQVSRLASLTNNTCYLMTAMIRRFFKDNSALTLFLLLLLSQLLHCFPHTHTPFFSFIAPLPSLSHFHLPLFLPARLALVSLNFTLRLLCTSRILILYWIIGVISARTTSPKFKRYFKYILNLGEVDLSKPIFKVKICFIKSVGLL